VPAGSDVIVSLHYTTNGKATVDRTRIGFTVAKAPPKKKYVVQGAGGMRGHCADGCERQGLFASVYIRILPSRRMTATTWLLLWTSRSSRDVELVRLRPHAHVRGKSAQYGSPIRMDVKKSCSMFRTTISTGNCVRHVRQAAEGSRLALRIPHDNSVEQQEQSRSEQMGVSRVPELGRDDGPQSGFLVDRDADIAGLMSVTN